jgi:putative NADPH-quinone reductase
LHKPAKETKIIGESFMRVYAILAHDKKDSLNGFIFSKIIEHLKTKNVELDILNLYDHVNQIPFFIHNKEILQQNKFFLENKERFMAADRLLIVHPIYWYSLPGILKCWVDLITNYAWKYEKGEYAKALHKIKKAMVVNTSMDTAWHRRFFTANPAKRQMQESLKFFGINKFFFYQIGGIYKPNFKPTVEKHIQKILKLTNKII